VSSSSSRTAAASRWRCWIWTKRRSARGALRAKRRRRRKSDDDEEKKKEEEEEEKEKLLILASEQYGERILEISLKKRALYKEDIFGHFGHFCARSLAAGSNDKGLSQLILCFMESTKRFFWIESRPGWR